jgi:hypothetical protein
MNNMNDPFGNMIDNAFSNEFFNNDPFFSNNRNSNMQNRMLEGGNNDNHNQQQMSVMNNMGGNMGGFDNNNIMSFFSQNNFGSEGMGGGKDGSTVFSSSYVSSVTYDKGGKPVKKEFQSQGIDHFKNGQKISEKKQAFKDYENGIKKASQQRTLNDVGQKIIKTRDYRNNETSENTYYRGMNEGKFLMHL